MQTADTNLTERYEAYVKRAVADGNDRIMSPPEWLARCATDTQSANGKANMHPPTKAHLEIPMDPERKAFVIHEFKKLMIAAGHGDIMERVYWELFKR